MTLDTITNQTIALAGIAQATALVDQLATKGIVDSASFKTSIESILKIDSDSVLDVYGGDLAHLTLGFDSLKKQVSGFSIEHPEQARYGASLVFLENKLSEQPALLQKISIGLARAQNQAEHFGVLHDNVIANLGDIYYNTVSTIQPRIMVNGDPAILSRPDIANKIRASLLAGIRSSMLWRQCGGKRWKFIFFRKKIQDELQRLLNEKN